MQEQKRALRIKTSALNRLLKEYNNYLIEKSKYNMDSSGVDQYAFKKIKMFYEETESALSAVRNSLENHRDGLTGWMLDNQMVLEEEEIKTEVQAAREALGRVLEVVPEEAAPV